MPRKKPEKSAPKPTKSQMQERVTEVYRLLLLGSSRVDILQYAAKNYGIETRAADDLIAKARKLQQDNVKERQDSIFSECVSRYDELYKTAREKEDVKSCIAINKEISELFHLKEEETKTAAITITFTQGEEKVL